MLDWILPWLTDFVAALEIIDGAVIGAISFLNFDIETIKY
jgi:hypothetical protein